MLSKNQIKVITSLQQKKYRKQHGLFLAEGIKVIQELLNSNFELHHLYVTEALFKNVAKDKIDYITEQELKKITALNTPNNCLALFKIPQEREITTDGLMIALDDVRDPGNLGTILRLCDWFGIKEVVCSNETVDIFNPKVVQATMGSISRVNVVYTDLRDFLGKAIQPVYGTFMDGKNLYRSDLPAQGIIVMGNEANGISPAIEKLCTQRIAIPRFGDLQQTESLNVATATAIILSEFRREEGKALS
ncbi:TrmH family RNA methyltransferase [Flavobacterium suncheonense]|uniref:RNA methyltransferase n=1 Tax=Flavobacterium suncheonense GH29-5 = DSM 17707 TaxID=1121899 RepID=A0A0A2M6Q3_9FLAO|nr:RNA methyltransferase [Flavobacterium suncheonense]KGO88327.1 RNA methyltransferase [Flavobacterium suncheonense GH29-5 = DSM 17707]